MNFTCACGLTWTVQPTNSVVRCGKCGVTGSSIGGSVNVYQTPILKCATVGCPGVPVLGMVYCPACHSVAAKLLAPYASAFQNLATPPASTVKFQWNPAPKIPEPIKPVRISDPVIGFRVLRILTQPAYRKGLPDTIVLDSMLHSQPWVPGEWQRAFCASTSGHRHISTRPDCLPEVPSLHCHCGIYAYNSPRHVFMDAQAEIAQGALIVGIQATGKIVWCDRGFRAERAQILAILKKNRLRANVIGAGRSMTLPGNSSSELRQIKPETIAKEYGVPALWNDDFMRYCGEYGSTYDVDQILRLTDDKPKEYPY